MNRIEKEHLFFIGIVPPETIQERILKFKLEINQMCGSKHAFNAPAHITLHMPFALKSKNRQLLLKHLSDVKLEGEKEKIHIKNFGSFTPRVIYAAVQLSETMEKLQKLIAIQLRKLQVFNADYKDRPFLPHITVAFRDLKKRDFLTVWNVFEHRQFEMEFELSAFHLLEYLGNEWRMVAAFEL